MKAAIIDIQGIGPAAEATLAEHGFTSVKKLAGTTVEKLAAVPGFSEVRAGKVISAASGLLPADSGSEEKSKGKKDKKDKKGKKGKKDKKGKKGKKDKKGKK